MNLKMITMTAMTILLSIFNSSYASVIDINEALNKVGNALLKLDEGKTEVEGKYRWEILHGLTKNKEKCQLEMDYSPKYNQSNFYIRNLDIEFTGVGAHFYYHPNLTLNNFEINNNQINFDFKEVQENRTDWGWPLPSIRSFTTVSLKIENNKVKSVYIKNERSEIFNKSSEEATCTF